MSTSRFAGHFQKPSPILELMEDLGEALNTRPDCLFLGGGNPAQIPAATALFKKHFKALAEDADVEKLMGIYQSPQGEEQTLALLAQYYREKCGWQVSEKNIALVNGSQTAFFILLNLFAGTAEPGVDEKKILLPLVPEYLGYESQVLSDDAFITLRPKVLETSAHRFKYQLDLNFTQLSSSVGAIACSRPTNPSGNVLTDSEIQQLSELAKQAQVPLIIDNAYGQPFPNLVYTDASPYWDSHVISVSSLSKCGLPGLRTGVVVADPEIIEQVVRANIVMSLANGNLGPFLFKRLMQSGDLDRLTGSTLPDFYLSQRAALLRFLEAQLAGIPYKIHEPEGAFFLWCWFPELNCSSESLYQALKQQGVLIMSGQPFFFEHQHDWDHARQCIRLSYCQPETVLKQAAKIIAQTVRSFA